MVLTFLGTGAAEAWPAAFCACKLCECARRVGDIRAPASVLIDGRYLIDLPPGIELSAAHRKVCLAGVTDLFITHSHPDHLDPGALTGRVSPCGYQPDLPLLRIHCNRRSADVLDGYGEFNQFYNPEKLAITIHVVEPFATFSAGDLTVTTLLANHGTAPDRDPLNYILGRDGRKILYACDSGWFPEATWRELERHKLDFVVLECTTYWREKGVDKEYHHLDMSTFLAVRDRLVEAGCLKDAARVVASHVCHHPAQGKLEERLKGENVTLAADGLCLEL